MSRDELCHCEQVGFGRPRIVSWMKDAEVSRVPCLFSCVNSFFEQHPVLFRVICGVDFNVVSPSTVLNPYGLRRGDRCVRVLRVGHVWYIDGYGWLLAGAAARECWWWCFGSRGWLVGLLCFRAWCHCWWCGLRSGCRSVVAMQRWCTHRSLDSRIDSML